MKVNIRIFIFCLLSLFTLYVIWVHAYDVFYNGTTSTIFGGDPVKYLNLGFEKQSLLNKLSNFDINKLGSLFSLYGILIISYFLNDSFGNWALYASLFLNLIIVYFSYYILNISYNFFLVNFKKNALVITYLFPAILLYLVGPNKEIFSFLCSCLLVRISLISALINKRIGRFKYELLTYTLIFILITFFREVYLLIGLLTIPIFILRSTRFRYVFLYISTILLYFIRPENYENSWQLLQQESSVVTLFFTRYFDTPITYFIQLLAKFLVPVFGILYPSRLSEIPNGNIYFIIRLLFCFSMIILFVNLFKYTKLRIIKFKFSKLSQNLLYSLVIYSLSFSLSTYVSDRKIIPSYPIVFALTASLIRDKKLDNSNIKRDFIKDNKILI